MDSQSPEMTLHTVMHHEKIDISSYAYYSYVFDEHPYLHTAYPSARM